ncbi:hypothetical protein OW492_13500 [Psychromonas sp. 14N.309.X.WAT.B.A12]|uniref:hypothetical protein n=1 Tax=Psychromonas sp. 14N.309.X.WAT.B.A12 TaxID=2998322 RepID=UPI0025AF53CC|nr:hypothetical protein [Psychromonas sp. 14N.309.X.WAT.B.A12]MDN2664386.1 hypothetical protein [Psychromonas sp. 14N.309.X.WAT.B.A12]
MDINLNQPKTLIFHPGIGKTATSAIQNIGFKLPSNKSEEACFSPYGFFGGASNYFASNHPEFSMTKFTEQWDALLTFAASRESSTVISSEFLIRDNPKHIALMLTQAKEKGLNVKVIVAVRNYTDYLISAFLQAVKVNWGIPDNENIFMFCERELAQVRMPLLVDYWAKHIGDENVFLMDYDKDKKGFVNLFFKTIDLDVDSGDKKENKVNESIRLEIAPMLRHFDRVTSNKQQRPDFIKFLNSLDYKEQHSKNVKQRIDNKIVRNAFTHDKERLSARYTWI